MMTTNPNNRRISLEEEFHLRRRATAQQHGRPHHIAHQQQQRASHQLLAGATNEEVGGMGNARIDTNSNEWLLLQSPLLLGSSMSPLNRLRCSNNSTNQYAIQTDSEHYHDESLKKRPSTSSSSNCSGSTMGTINNTKEVDMMEMIMWSDLEPTPIGPQESIQVVLPPSATQTPPLSVSQQQKDLPIQVMDSSSLSPSVLECLRPLLLLPRTPASSDGKLSLDSSGSYKGENFSTDSITKSFPPPTLHHQISRTTETTFATADATSDTESTSVTNPTNANHTNATLSSSSTPTNTAPHGATATSDNDDDMMAITNSRVIVKAAAEAAALQKKGKRFRMSQAEQWGERYKELIKFKEMNGHCVVPLCYPINTTLSHWVKRQRCQYKLKHAGKRSTLTDDREHLLEELGFTWDSHNASWEERYHDLVKFKSMNGHCNVPSSYPPNPSLAGWIKCQRRYVRMYYEHKERGSIVPSPTTDDNYDNGDVLLASKSSTGAATATSIDSTTTKRRSSSHSNESGRNAAATATAAAAQLKSTMRYSLNSERVKRLVDLGLRWKKFHK